MSATSQSLLRFVRTIWVSREQSTTAKIWRKWLVSAFLIWFAVLAAGSILHRHDENFWMDLLSSAFLLPFLLIIPTLIAVKLDKRSYRKWKFRKSCEVCGVKPNLYFPLFIAVSRPLASTTAGHPTYCVLLISRKECLFVKCSKELLTNKENAKRPYDYIDTLLLSVPICDFERVTVLPGQPEKSHLSDFLYNQTVSRLTHTKRRTLHMGAYIAFRFKTEATEPLRLVFGIPDNDENAGASGFVASILLPELLGEMVEAGSDLAESVSTRHKGEDAKILNDAQRIVRAMLVECEDQLRSAYIGNRATQQPTASTPTSTS